MTVTTINTSTFISDITIFIRNELVSNLSDPLGTRATGEKFVMTSYPERDVKYPIITLQTINVQEIRKLGMQTEMHYVEIPLEIRVWARNVKERDYLSQAVINQLRSFEHDSDGTVQARLTDFRIENAVNVDEAGIGGIKSRVIQVRYKFILGA